MKLCAPEVAAPDNRRKGDPVVGTGNREVGYRNGEAVHEINIVAGCDAFEDGVPPDRRELIPAHVWNRPSLRRLQTFDLVGEYAETVGIALVRALEEELHAAADTQNGLGK